jgi:hypothetical protein
VTTEKNDQEENREGGNEQAVALSSPPTTAATSKTQESLSASGSEHVSASHAMIVEPSGPGEWG